MPFLTDEAVLARDMDGTLWYSISAYIKMGMPKG
eukprot:CAMPEP_0114153720 /NCGR_PEP_ID=MMETSP0043_2-20121206/24516_1 /TAXON_ID=464988 /ORGANISM="Hemiselmis andersenii, Strain CCMP644" /LENGTH=33 /DNA_ID= /DNA_START= /DNA_END= /DNA_ORIENTATION=